MSIEMTVSEIAEILGVVVKQSIIVSNNFQKKILKKMLKELLSLSVVA